MATLTVRDVNDRDYAHLVEIARENDRSVAAEVRALIADRARLKKGTALAGELRAFRAANPIKLHTGEDAVSIVRAVRDD